MDNVDTTFKELLIIKPVGIIFKLAVNFHIPHILSFAPPPAHANKFGRYLLYYNEKSATQLNVNINTFTAEGLNRKMVHRDKRDFP